MPKVEINIDELDYECDEAYKTLRTNLQFCGEDKKALVLTSCTPDEGKSTVALRLAISLAEAGKRVLLLDADLRKSVMTGNFKFSDAIKGLTHFLSGQTGLKDIICTTDMDNLHVIFSGPFAPNPAELLGDRQFKELLKVAREHYDYILIDSAPLGNVIDSAIIAESCDGAIIVIEAEVISYRFVQEIQAQLERSNCPILGTILNKVDTRAQKYYSRYYGRKYGRYYGKYYGGSYYGKK